MSIMSQISFQFMENKLLFTEYGKEILCALFEDEKHNIQLKKASDQLNFRHTMLNLMLQFTNHQEYTLATLHLGAYILDVYMDSYIISEIAEHQKLIALVCLVLAAKSEDLDETIPSIKDILQSVDLSHDLGVDLRFREELEPDVVTEAYKAFASMYCNLEFLIFESLRFNTIRPTVVNFMNVFQNIVVTDCDLKYTNNNEEASEQSLAELCVNSKIIIKQFLDIVILDIDFFNILPSLLAASIVGITRKLLNIMNYWTQELANLTRCSGEEIEPLMNILMEKRMAIVHQESHGDDVPMSDSGYSASANDSFQLEPRTKKRKYEDRPSIVYSIL